MVKYNEYIQLAFTGGGEENAELRCHPSDAA